MRRSLAVAVAALVAGSTVWAANERDQRPQQGQPHETSGQRGGFESPAGGQARGSAPAQGYGQWQAQERAQNPGSAQPNRGGGQYGTFGHGPAQSPSQGYAQERRPMQNWSSAGQTPTGAWQGGRHVDSRASRSDSAFFDRRINSGRWTANRSQWSGANRNWAQSSLWRDDRNWWRGRSEFRGYHGERAGFWFAPGFGYYAVSAALWDRRWDRGQFLPFFLRRYRVADWQDYGLPPPPWGCAWVWINGGVALIDLTDGYILDVDYGLY
jgi:Ni/Co efflux regulator RcnB